MKNIFNIDPNKEILRIKINWALVSAFVIFWSYGFFGILTSKTLGLTANILLSIILCGFFVLFLCFWKKFDLYKDSIVIKNKDLLALASFFVIMFALSLSNLTLPLDGDNLIYAYQSKTHSITLISFLSSKTTAFNNLNFKWLIYIIDLLTIVFFLLARKFIKSKKWLLTVFLLALLFLSFRFTIMALGGNGTTSDPPLKLFPLWLSSAIFTSSNFAFRFAQFFGLVIMMWLVQRFINKNLKFVYSWLFALTVGTIPVLWHVGSIVQSSIWTGFSWTLFLLYFVNERENNTKTVENRKSYAKWFSVIFMFSMMRQSGFVAFVPLFCFMLVDFLKNKEFSPKFFFVIISPLLAAIVFILNGVINGQASLYAGNAIDYLNIPAGASSLQRVWIAFSSGIISRSIIHSVGWIWIIFLFCIALLLVYKHYSKFFIVSFFFLAGIFLFYAIDPAIWGVGKYQAEYIIPFIIFGFFLICKFMYDYSNLSRKFLPLIFIFLIIYNIYIFKNLATINWKVLTEGPFEYKQALQEAMRSGYTGKFFTLSNADAAVFADILSGFTVRETLTDKKIYDDIKIKNPTPFNGLANAINQNQKVNLTLIITDQVNTEKLRLDLENLGWKKWQEFKSKRGGTIYGMVREKK